MRIASLQPRDLLAAKSLLADACHFDQAEVVAEEKLFGDGACRREARPIGAFDGAQLLGLACTSNRWLRLLAVGPKHRGRGVGSSLLEACEVEIGRHATYVRCFDQPGNYLSPGIDERNQELIGWLTRRGYRQASQSCNLLIKLHDNPKISDERLAALRATCADAGFRIVRIPTARIDADCQTIAEAFSEGWAFEVSRSAKYRESGVHIAVDEESSALASFAAHDGNNRGLGWFGPTGTLPTHRGKGLAAALLMACLLDVRQAGHTHCQVAWIGPRDFYEKVAGIDSERHFSVMIKDLCHD